MKSLRSFFARLLAWRPGRPWNPPAVVPALLVTYSAPIYREVSANGVRVYSLCGTCGSRLEASATLCDACAQKRSRQAR